MVHRKRMRGNVLFFDGNGSTQRSMWTTQYNNLIRAHHPDTGKVQVAGPDPCLHEALEYQDWFAPHKHGQIDLERDGYSVVITGKLRSCQQKCRKTRPPEPSMDAPYRQNRATFIRHRCRSCICFDGVVDSLSHLRVSHLFEPTQSCT